jgi:hypothetical protein
MITKAEIEQFYKDVDELALKFPGSAIAKRTNFNKGIVSEYLNKKKEPSENFLRAFYNAFPKGSPNVSRNTVSGGNNISSQSDLSALIQNNSILTAAIDKAQDNISKAQDNIAKCQEDQRELIHMLKAERSTVGSDRATMEEMTNLLIGLREYTTELGAKMKKTDPVSELQELHKKVSQAKRSREKKDTHSDARR